MGFVEHDQIPRQRAQSFSWRSSLRDIWSSRTMRWSMVLERIAARRGGFQFFGEDAELQAELLEQFIAPLLDQAAGGDDEDAAGVGPHDELADVEAGHDGLARAGVVGQDKPQRLARQHGLVDGGDLVRQRLHVRRVDGHHRVEQEGEVNALGLDGELERLAVAVEGPGALGGGEGDVGFVGAVEEAFLERAVGGLVDDLHRAFGDGNHGNNRGDC